jgi:hypothetical protein
MTKKDDELAKLKARVEELERAAAPPKPFVPEPYQRYDPTAGMCMPPSALAAMVAAVPDRVMRDIVRDNRNAPTGPTGRGRRRPRPKRRIQSPLGRVPMICGMRRPTAYPPSYRSLTPR